jgi:hypothetical protein
MSSRKGFVVVAIMSSVVALLAVCTPAYSQLVPSSNTAQQPNAAKTGPIRQALHLGADSGERPRLLSRLRGQQGQSQGLLSRLRFKQPAVQPPAAITPAAPTPAIPTPVGN